ncbi:MAG TPA: hypothetical protein VJ001_06820 [Rhodocyclaceae bacterium]|nr:hypothetical protein [Rhodocyclaceae bacterium]
MRPALFLSAFLPILLMPTACGTKTALSLPPRQTPATSQPAPAVPPAPTFDNTGNPRGNTP